MGQVRRLKGVIIEPDIPTTCVFCEEDFLAKQKGAMYCCDSHRVLHKRNTDSYTYFQYICSHSKKRKTLSPQDLMELWEEQDGRCALTGIQMTKILGKGKILTNVSVDRIEAGGPYVKENVQLVCCAINIFRGNLSVEEFQWWCKKVVNHAES